MRGQRQETVEETLQRLAAGGSSGDGASWVVEKEYAKQIHRGFVLGVWTVAGLMLIVFGLWGYGGSFPGGEGRIGLWFAALGVPFLALAVLWSRQQTVIEPGGVRYATPLRQGYARWDQIEAVSTQERTATSKGGFTTALHYVTTYRYAAGPRYGPVLHLTDGTSVPLMRALPFWKEADCDRLCALIGHHGSRSAARTTDTRPAP
jgi:hypothetical protein